MSIDFGNYRLEIRLASDSPHGCYVEPFCLEKIAFLPKEVIEGLINELADKLAFRFALSGPDTIELIPDHGKRNTRIEEAEATLRLMNILQADPGTNNGEQQ